MKATTYKNPLVQTEQAFLNNPYPELALLRGEAPVYWCEESKYWLVSSYADVQNVLRNNRFGKQIQRWKYTPGGFFVNFVPPLKFLRQTSASWLLNLNPPDHSRVRGLVNKAFTPATLARLLPEIENLAAVLIDEMEALGGNGVAVDLVDKFAFPFPLAVIGLILGMPLSDGARLRAWSHQVVGLVGGQREVKKLLTAGRGMQQFAAYLKPHIEDRIVNPKDDLLSVLVQAREQDASLNLQELIGTSILMLVAGFETTVNLIANTIFCLESHREQRTSFMIDMSLADAVVREVLRFESPVQTAPRLAEEDVEINGQKVKKGDMLWLLLGSANRDEKQFTSPDLFDISRESARNLSFGDGIHRCVGANLAEIEAAIALKSLYGRFPDLRLAVETVDFKKPFALRGPQTLPVLL